MQIISPKSNTNTSKRAVMYTHVQKYRFAPVGQLRLQIRTKNSRNWFQKSEKPNFYILILIYSSNYHELFLRERVHDICSARITASEKIYGAVVQQTVTPKM